MEFAEITDTPYTQLQVINIASVILHHTNLFHVVVAGLHEFHLQALPNKFPSETPYKEQPVGS